MKLRRELSLPKWDRRLVAHLTKLAEEIDCGDPEKTQAAVVAFNRRAGTDYQFIDFQGIYGGEDHDVWVRKVLAGKRERVVPDITRQELVELARRVMKLEGGEYGGYFWLRMLELHLPGSNISDLIYWPRIYFDDPEFSQDLSPAQVIDLALAENGPGCVKTSAIV